MAPVIAVALVLANTVLAGNETVQVPSNHGYALDQALSRLHAAGLQASFPTVTARCGSGLPYVNVQSPRSPARVASGTVVSIHFMPQPLPSFAAPKVHPKWLTVPHLVGLDYRTAQTQLTGLWPCLGVVGSPGVAASNVVVISQSPRAGSRVRAYGMKVNKAFNPTLIHLTVAAGEPFRPTRPTWLASSVRQASKLWFGAQPIRIDRIDYPASIAVVLSFDHPVSCGVCGSSPMTGDKPKGTVFRFKFDRKTHQVGDGSDLEVRLCRSRLVCLYR